jgi:hypothetical protein
MDQWGRSDHSLLAQEAAAGPVPAGDAPAAVRLSEPFIAALAMIALTATPAEFREERNAARVTLFRDRKSPR